MQSSPARQVGRLRLYRMMQLIRRVEERLIVEYRAADQMRCPMHFCIGQESAPAVLSQLLRTTDVLMSHYRSHGYYLGKGGSLDEMIAEFFGRATGSNSGIAGSMELSSHENNFFSGAIVGGSVMVPLGAAFAQKYKGSTAISIAVVGDGSFDEGVLYEAMNLAALYRLPILLICENNKYAANTSIAARHGRPELLAKAEAMGIRGEIVEGYDLDALSDRLAFFVDDVRRGGGPRYLEVMTYRYCAHVGPEPDDYLEYRSPLEIEGWRAKDPLIDLRTTLSMDPTTLTRIAEADAQIEQQITASIEAAKAAPFPSLDWALGINRADTYTAAAEGYFRDLTPMFQGGQREAKLEPF